MYFVNHFFSMHKKILRSPCRVLENPWIFYLKKCGNHISCIFLQLRFIIVVAVFVDPLLPLDEVLHKIIFYAAETRLWTASFLDDMQELWLGETICIYYTMTVVMEFSSMTWKYQVFFANSIATYIPFLVKVKKKFHQDKKNLL